jgi:protein ImuA
MRREPVRPQPPAAFGVCETTGKADAVTLIEALRRHIGRIEQSQQQLDHDRRRGQPWTLGVEAIDSHLAAQGLARNGLHDISPGAYGNQPAAMGFALALALRRMADPAERRPLLWCRLAREEREWGRLYGHGLETLGLPRRRFITVTLKKPVALLWTMEEALKSGALAVVMGDADAAHAGLTATRRLSLAAHAGKSAGLMVFAGEAAAATASHSRWSAAAAPSRAPPYDPQAPGSPMWRVELTRARGGRPGAWDLEWKNAPHRFAVVPGLRGGEVHPWTDESRKNAAAAASALRAG